MKTKTKTRKPARKKVIYKFDLINKRTLDKMDACIPGRDYLLKLMRAGKKKAITPREAIVMLLCKEKVAWATWVYQRTQNKSFWFGQRTAEKAGLEFEHITAEEMVELVYNNSFNNYDE